MQENAAEPRQAHQWKLEWWGEWLWATGSCLVPKPHTTDYYQLQPEKSPATLGSFGSHFLQRSSKTWHWEPQQKQPAHASWSHANTKYSCPKCLPKQACRRNLSFPISIREIWGEISIQEDKCEEMPLKCDILKRKVKFSKIPGLAASKMQ